MSIFGTLEGPNTWICELHC